MAEGMRRILAGGRALWERIEDGFLCLLLAAMTGLACWQIVLRFFFASGLLWADQLLRYLVLWSGMFGAVIATREGRHIAIDIISYLLPQRWLPALRLVLALLSAVVSGVLTWAAVVFVENERLFDGETLLEIPLWGWGLVFPLAFALITLRFLGRAVAEMRLFANGGNPIQQERGGSRP